MFTLSRTLALANAIAVALALVSAGPAAGQGGATIGVQSNADLAFGAASYTVTIDGGNPHYTIVLPSAITLQGPSNATMTVDSITSDPVGGGKTAPPQRIGHFTVGGTLRVSANQPSGVYAAPFLVTVNLGN